MIEKTFQIKNKLGLHARPCALFVQTTSKFKSTVSVTKDGQAVDGKSIMGLMILTAECDSNITVKIDGEDEKDMLIKVEELIGNKFDEE